MKEFNRLRALEEGKGETPAANGDSRPPAVDPGLQKAMDLCDEVLTKTWASIVQDELADERSEIIDIINRLWRPNDKTSPSQEYRHGYNAALEKVEVAIRERGRVGTAPAADHG